MQMLASNPWEKQSQSIFYEQNKITILNWGLVLTKAALIWPSLFVCDISVDEFEDIVMLLYCIIHWRLESFCKISVEQDWASTSEDTI